MTTLAVLADVHGNLPALEAVLRDLDAFRPDAVVVAGDLINWGPFSRQVLERLARPGWSVIRGNNEFYLLDYQTPRAPAEWSDAAQYSVLPWLHEQLNGRWSAAIAAWPDSLSLRFRDAPPVRVVHGSPRSPWEPIFATSSEDEIAAMLAEVEETTLVAGHTHLRLDRRVGGRHLLNPGSVGVPLDGLHAASYLLLTGAADGWRPTFRRVAYDRAALFEEFERQRFVERCGVVGHLLIEEFRTARLQLAPFLRWRAAHHAATPLTWELLDEFNRANAWDYMPAAYHLNRDLDLP